MAYVHEKRKYLTPRRIPYIGELLDVGATGHEVSSAFGFATTKMLLRALSKREGNEELVERIKKTPRFKISRSA